jgi:hypothetical protein
MGLLQSSPFSIAEQLQLHRCQSSAPYNSEFEHILMFFNFDLAYVMILSIGICDNCYFGRLITPVYHRMVARGLLFMSNI